MPTQDLISGLPDIILIVILSLLDMKQIVRTSVLSKRFQHLWMMVSTLVFKKGNQVHWGYIAWVHHVLLHRCTVDIPIKKLTIDCEFATSYISNVDEWFMIAKAKRVEDLTLRLGEYRSYQLPHCICCNSSLVKLSLTSCKIMPCESFDWPSLQKLTISMEVKTDIVSKILDASPKLKYMKLLCCGGREPLHINSTSLVKLVITKIGLYTSSPSNLSAPNLEFLHLSGTSHGLFQLVNVSSLCRVVLDYTFINDDETLCVYYTEFLNSILHVDYLELGQEIIQALSLLEIKCLRPPISSRTWLKLNVLVDRLDTPGIIYMLKGSPNLETAEICLLSQRSLINYYFSSIGYYLRSYWSTRAMVLNYRLSKLKTTRLLGFNNQNSDDELRRKVIIGLLLGKRNYVRTLRRGVPPTGSS